MDVGGSGGVGNLKESSASRTESMVPSVTTEFALATDEVPSRAAGSMSRDGLAA